ncbi:MAG: HDIG domain-containing protein [Gemmatimonadetes bacterium]|nr:HDIG domain-containing protein [Gemmatimonadota bacterium]NIO30462.1 HDIG domain-containing protein [Gemmatimonadota bacterium]
MNPGRKGKITVRIRYLMRELTRRRGVQLLARRFSQGYRLLLLVSAALVIVFVFPRGSARDVIVLQEGMVAQEDVIAPVTFPVYKSEAELTRARAEAAAGVEPIFDHGPELADSSISAARAFFDTVEAIVAGAADQESGRREVRALLDEYGIAASENQVALLMAAESRALFWTSVESTFQGLLRPGVVSGSDLGDVASSGVSLRSAAGETLVRGDSLTTMEQFFERADSRSPSELGVDAHRLFHNIIVHFARPTIVLNRVATAAARVQAQRAVNRIAYEVLEGEMIVAAHERVGAEQRERLVALQQQLAGQESRRLWPANLGGFLYNILLLVVLGLVVRYYRPDVYASGRSLTLIWFLVLAVAGAAALISRTEAAWQLIPIAFAALTIATLYDGVLALLTAFVLVALISSSPAFAGIHVTFFTVMGGAAAALSGRVVRRRAHTWAFAAVIAGTYILTAFSLGLMGLQDTDDVVLSVFWGTVNGVGCTLLAVGVLPLAESFTKITTDQSLLELADVNRPLLRRLSLEAPGTYAHSINVANLAEAAAREIGANALLVRVGVYYHDIGKVKKPQYFVENQPPRRNPHDKLKPVTSAGIVREHVKDGLELAEEARLPETVMAFITEHHGTQKIGFFWDRALELDPEAELSSKDFRYGGPKPQSKETAIVLLADSVESAARVLQDPTPEGIEELVDRIVGFKISEGQLDEAPLTMREIDMIKQQFVKVLTSMYHHRLDYPLQNSQAAEAEAPAAPGAS